MAAAVYVSAAVGSCALIAILRMQTSRDREGMSKGANVSRRVRQLRRSEIQIRSVMWRGKNYFYRHFVRKSRPVIFTDVVETWEAYLRWTPAFLKKIGSHCRVHVSSGVEESSCLESFKSEETLADFIDRLTNGNPVAENVYLKQFLFFSHFPEERKFVYPESFFSSLAIFSTSYVWIGKMGSTTGLHSDDEENILCQIRGTKRVYLYPPSEREFLYPNKKYDSGTECCDVNPAVPDLKLYPNFAYAKPAVVANLTAGDALYIPKGWFHYVETTAHLSISLNYFCSNPYEMLTVGLARELRHLWHLVQIRLCGGHTKPGCVCHG